MITSALLRYGSLAVLIVQDAGLVLLMRQTRTAGGDGPMYLASTAVLMMETLKMASCLIATFVIDNNCDFGKWANQVGIELTDPRTLGKMGVPGCLYLVQNNLLYYALSNLQATTYKVAYNLKIITGAFFSVALLGEKLTPAQWGSLVMLVVGLSVIQVGKLRGTTADAVESDEVASELLGMCAVLGAAVISGFCGVYQQRVLQGSNASIWVRNAQMGVSSLMFGITSVFLKDSEAVLEGGFFQGYTASVWAVVLLQAFGGLNVAFILKYADNILKGFAAAFSTFACGVIEMACFHFSPTAEFVFGAVLIHGSAFAYGFSKVKSVPASSTIAAPARNASPEELQKNPSSNVRSSKILGTSV